MESPCRQAARSSEVLSVRPVTMLDADAQVRVALLQILDTAKIRKYLEGHNVNILRRQVRKYPEGHNVNILRRQVGI